MRHPCNKETSSDLQLEVTIFEYKIKCTKYLNLNGDVSVSSVAAKHDVKLEIGQKMIVNDDMKKQFFLSQNRCSE